MFQNLLHFWRGKDFLSQVLDEFKKMLDDTHQMFDSVCCRLIDNKEEAGLRDNIYSLDKKVNSLEKDIRKRIIEHLAIQPSVDLPTSLLLMSVVKDAERLGDYAKNLFEVTNILDGPLDKEKYLQFFDNIGEDLERLFNITKEAFIDSDEKQAASAWNFETKIVKRCEDAIVKLANGNLPVNTAVSFTLIARYFKRTAAHLTNIATSVIVPLDQLDYFREKRKKTI
ncbi:MAG: PhoU domain-containing protein [Candidatus Omnitrophota bacterium]